MKFKSLVHRFYKLTFSDLYPRLVKKMHFQFMNNTVMPYNKDPCPRCHEIYNLVDPSLVSIAMHILSDLCSALKKIFKRNMDFTLLSQNHVPFFMKFTTLPSLVRIGLLVLEKKMVTQVNL